MNKQISTVIPVFNDADALRHALMSVCTQSVPPLEVVVLDDASTDGIDDVMERYTAAYPFVRRVRYETKSANWKRDAYLNALKHTQGEYIHSLSANDTISPHFYQCAQLCRNEGVIFAEFIVRHVDGHEMGVAACEMLPGQHEYPRAELLKQLCRTVFFEGGPACLVRRDALQWLCDRDFWEMETWNDSIGYSVAAWLFGASYLTYPCGTFTYDPTGDGEKRKHSPEWALPMYKAVCRFLSKLTYQLPEELIYGLQRKVYNVVPRHFRAVEMTGMEFPLPQNTSLATTAPTPAAVEATVTIGDLTDCVASQVTAKPTFPAAPAINLATASESP